MTVSSDSAGCNFSNRNAEAISLVHQDSKSGTQGVDLHDHSNHIRMARYPHIVILIRREMYVNASHIRNHTAICAYRSVRVLLATVVVGVASMGDESGILSVEHTNKFSAYTSFHSCFAIY